MHGCRNNVLPLQLRMRMRSTTTRDVAIAVAPPPLDLAVKWKMEAPLQWFLDITEANECISLSLVYCTVWINAHCSDYTLHCTLHYPHHICRCYPQAAIICTRCTCRKHTCHFHFHSSLVTPLCWQLGSGSFSLSSLALYKFFLLALAYLFVLYVSFFSRHSC